MEHNRLRYQSQLNTLRRQSASPAHVQRSVSGHPRLRRTYSVLHSGEDTPDANGATGRHFSEPEDAASRNGS